MLITAATMIHSVKLEDNIYNSFELFMSLELAVITEGTLSGGMISKDSPGGMCTA